MIKVWDVETGASKLDTEGHGNIIQSTKWSWDGAQMVTACKDKKLRMFDPRQPDAIQEWHGHDGVKGPRAIFCGKTGFICSAGTSKVGKIERGEKKKKKRKCFSFLFFFFLCLVVGSSALLVGSEDAHRACVQE